MPAPDAFPAKARDPGKRGGMNWGRIAGLTDFVKRYGAVSLICYVTNNLLLIGLDSLGAALWLSVTLSAAILIVLAFMLHAWITFSRPMNWPSFGKFALVQLPNVPIAYALLWLLNEPLDLPMHYSAPVVTTALLLWNLAGSVWALRRR